VTVVFLLLTLTFIALGIGFWAIDAAVRVSPRSVASGSRHGSGRDLHLVRRRDERGLQEDCDPRLRVVLGDAARGPSGRAAASAWKQASGPAAVASVPRRPVQEAVPVLEHPFRMREAPPKQRHATATPARGAATLTGLGTTSPTTTVTPTVIARDCRGEQGYHQKEHDEDCCPQRLSRLTGSGRASGTAHPRVRRNHRWSAADRSS